MLTVAVRKCKPKLAEIFKNIYVNMGKITLSTVKSHVPVFHPNRHSHFAVLLDTGRPVSLRLECQDNRETGLLLWNVVTYAYHTSHARWSICACAPTLEALVRSSALKRKKSSKLYFYNYETLSQNYQSAFYIFNTLKIIPLNDELLAIYNYGLAYCLASQFLINKTFLIMT